jgi:HPt (histidine-containing phosphotransfer) domain-containing protein
LLDPAALHRLVDLTGDREFVESLLSEFRDEARTTLDQLLAAAPDGFSDVRLHAHSLKSSSAQLGAAALSECAAKVEAAAVAADASAIEQLTTDLAMLTSATLDEMARLDDW